MNIDTLYAYLYRRAPWTLKIALYYIDFIDFKTVDIYFKQKNLNKIYKFDLFEKKILFKCCLPQFAPIFLIIQD
jgi:hypothetical protein